MVSSGQHLVQQFVDAENRVTEHETEDELEATELDLESVLEKGTPVLKPTGKPKKKYSVKSKKT